MYNIAVYLKSCNLNAHKIAKEVNGRVLSNKNGFTTEAIICKEISDIAPIKLTQTRLAKTLYDSLTRMVTYVASNEWGHKDTLWREETIIVICNKSQKETVISEFNSYELVDTLLTKNCTLKFMKKYPSSHRFTDLNTVRDVTIIRYDILQDKSYV